MSEVLTLIHEAAPIAAPTRMSTRPAMMISRVCRRRLRTENAELTDLPAGCSLSALRMEEVRQILERSVDLLPQIRDVEYDDVDVAAEIVVPHPGENLRLRQDRPRIAHEQRQHLVVSGGQFDRLAGASDLMGPLIEVEVAHTQHIVLIDRTAR